MRVAKGGYTLLEIVAVLMIIGLVGVCAIGHVKRMHALMLEADVRLLASTILYLQHEALATGVAQELVCDPKNAWYHYQGTTSSLSRHTIYGSVPGAFGPPANPERPVVSPVTFAHNKVQIHPDGTISAGCIYLATRDGSNSYALSCSVGRGHMMKLYRYNNGWQVLPLDGTP